MTTRVRDILVNARMLIATPDRWWQDTDGYHNRRPYSYCAIQAVGEAFRITRVHSDPHWSFESPAVEEATRLVRLSAGIETKSSPFNSDRHTVVWWNDQPTTKYEDIIAAFDKAIEATI